MKIVFENSGTRYDELKPGEAFFFHGDLYIKTNDITHADGSAMSVNCSSGIIHYFDGEVMVTPANCELHVL